MTVNLYDEPEQVFTEDTQTPIPVANPEEQPTPTTDTVPTVPTEQPTVEEEEVPQEESLEPEQGGIQGLLANIMESEPQNALTDFQALINGAAQGTGDFAFDAAGLTGKLLDVEWLQRADDWWDEHNPKSDDPVHTLVRDSSAIIIPSLIASKLLIGGAAAATVSWKIPAAQRTLLSLLAEAGIDVSVAGISSQSYEQDNVAGALNQILGRRVLPWGTDKKGITEDERKHLHMWEAAGFPFAVRMLLTVGAFAKKLRIFNKNTQAKIIAQNQADELRKVIPADEANPIDDALAEYNIGKNGAKNSETIERFEAKGGDDYDPFIHDTDITPSNPETVVNPPDEVFPADALGAKIDQYRIQNNIGTIDGIMRPSANRQTMRTISSATDATERGTALGNFFETLSADADVILDNKIVEAVDLNRAVDNLVENLFDPEFTFKEFEKVINEGKLMAFQGRKFLTEEKWVEASFAWKKAHELMFDSNQMRASAMVTQQAADSIVSSSRAMELLEELGTNTRQWEMVSEKMKLLVGEVTANKDIIARSNQLKKLVQQGDYNVVAEWLTDQADNFDAGIQSSRFKADRVIDEINAIAKEQPHWVRPLAEAYDYSNGDINTLYKLHKFTENHIGVLKKAFWDRNPEMPSFFVRGLHAIRYNSILNGMAPMNTLVGNSVMATLKPLSIFTGAVARGDAAVFKRAMYTYGGLIENFKRGFKVLGDEWRLANSNPMTAVKRGRQDIRMVDLDKFQVMETTAQAWRKEGKIGKVSLWNIAKAMTHYNNHRLNRWGINGVYAIDGFFKSLMASGASRAQAYDALFEATNGAVSKPHFKELQRHIYDNAFDKNGVLKNPEALFNANEIALNLDSKFVERFETAINHIPPAKALFLFPRTGANGLEFAWSFTPTSNLLPAITRARRALTARTAQDFAEVAADHGVPATDIAIKTVQSEYIGRQLMGTTVVMGAGMWALEGNLTGNGPQDPNERIKWIKMGNKPKSIKNPFTGEWHSYRGLQPFETILGLVGDMVYQANRVDESISEDWFRKLVSGITMNVSNQTLTSGFEPLVSLYSGREDAWKRFFAMQATTLFPSSSALGILNNALSPQLRDVENEFLQIASNKLFRSAIPGSGTFLPNQIDIYTGKPIKAGVSHIEDACRALMPVFKCQGGTEPWRQWLLSTGWHGLSEVETNQISGYPLSSWERQWINNWIGQHAGLKGQIIDLMKSADWTKELKLYKEGLGIRGLQQDTPIKKTLLHRALSKIHRNAYEKAWAALKVYYRQRGKSDEIEGRLRDIIEQRLQSGDTEGAFKYRDQLLQYK